MQKVIIAFGADTLITQLPDDYSVQFQLVESRLVFDKTTGQPVEQMPMQGRLNSASYYCIPFAGIVKLMQAIGHRIGEIKDASIELVLVDPLFINADESAKNIIFSCLNQAFAREIPAGFTFNYWQSPRNEDRSLSGQIQQAYLAECNKQIRSESGSVRDYIEQYIAQPQQKLNMLVGSYYLEVSEDFQSKFQNLQSQIQQFSSSGLSVGDILLRLYGLRLQRSIKLIVAALTVAEKPAHIVFIGQGNDAVGLDNVTVVKTKSILELMKKYDPENPDLPELVTFSLTNKRTIGFMMEALLQAVESLDAAHEAPFLIFAAYMYFLRQAENETHFSSQYFGAQFFINHIAISTAFKATHRYNHSALVAKFSEMSRDLVSFDRERSSLSAYDFQYYIEVLVYYLTNFLRGHTSGGASLVKIIPTEIVRALDCAVKVHGNQDILWRLFLIWLSTQLQAVNPDVLPRLITDISEKPRSYVGNDELFERIQRTTDVLNAVLVTEISRVHDRNDLRADVQTIAEILVSPSSGVDENLISDREAQRSLLERDAKLHDRFEVFIIPAETSIQDFLEMRLRLKEKTGRNIKLFYTERSGAAGSGVNILNVVAVAYHDGHQTIYFRCDIATHNKSVTKAPSLRENAPLTNAPILSIKNYRLPDGRQELAITWGVDPAEIYFGIENTEKHHIPDVILNIEGFHENSVFANIYRRLRRLRENAAQKPHVDEVLTAIKNINLTNLDALLASLDHAQLDNPMHQIYRFMRDKRRAGLFSLTMNHSGAVLANMSLRGEKWLALWNMVLMLAFGITLPTLIFGYIDTVVSYNDGDIFAELDELNAEVKRAGILVIYTAVPTLFAMVLSNYPLKWLTERYFNRELNKLPIEISDAIRSALLYRTLPKQVYQSLLYFYSKEKVIPDSFRNFMSALEQFADISEKSEALPDELKLALTDVDVARASQLMSNATIRQDQGVIGRSRQSEAMYLKVEGVTAAVTIAVAATFAGVYFGNITPQGEEGELSPLGLNGLYALGLAALTFIVIACVVLMRQLSTLYQTRDVSFFGERVANIRRDQSLQSVTVGAMPAVNEADLAADENDPLIGRRPGKSCNIL